MPRDATQVSKNATSTDNAKPIHIFIEQALIEEIEDYRFRHRFPTRVEAIRALLRLGLETDKKGKGSANRTGGD
jgi:metal-responsive CopG/Arc/MetJ family transcriptional regulator